MQRGQHPTLGNGKICYLEIPANDVDQAAAFYRKVFGWQSRRRGDGSMAFDDGVGEVSGTWTRGRKPVAEPGVLIYIMVDNLVSTLGDVVSNGGKIIQSEGMGREQTARFSDPTGNVFGLYQQPAQS